MTYRELQSSFETEALKYVTVEEKPYSKEIEFWLNLGLDKFVKNRYSGNTIDTTRYSVTRTKKDGFEMNQKRIDDLRTLVKILEVTDDTPIYSIEKGIKSIQLPSDYMFMLGETAYIIPNDSEYICWARDAYDRFIPKRTNVIEATIEDIDRRLSNTLSEHRLHNDIASPLRLFRGSSVYLYTDDNYNVAKYEYSYLKKPNKIDIHTQPNAEYTEMAEHTHNEIVKFAVGLFLENKANPRYQTHSMEIDTME